MRHCRRAFRRNPRLLLARRKAADVAQRLRADDPDFEGFVIGGDSMFELGDEILGKPADAADCKRMLNALSGRMHKVITGVGIFWPGGSLSFSDETSVQFYPLTNAEIDAYAASEEPYDKAGAYGIQGQGALLVAGIHGDYYNVMGLPVARLARQLKQLHLI